MKRQVKILDCTLRDGGYVNNWNFATSTIKSVVAKLAEANIDVIECGYLSETKGRNKGTMFASLQRINELLKTEQRQSGYACMINFGEYAAENLPAYCGCGIDTIRVAFHSRDLDAALDFCKLVQQKAYQVFVQPMITANYTPEQLAQLVKRANEFNPQAVYIVDSFGTMRKNEVVSLFQYFDANLNANIAVGFHSHNNLQLSFSNAQAFISEHSSRNLLIDSSIFGMGRGAGNLCTELITLYLNENWDADYTQLPILEVIDEDINPIFISTPWGYSVPYYIASAHKCHPNYASYLVQKQTLSVKAINLILSQIADGQKNSYDVKLIEQLYINFLSREVDDENVLVTLRKKFQNRSILLLAPGKTLQTYKEQISNYISQNNPVVISVNFVTDDYPIDVVFVSNLKRFASIDEETKNRLCKTTIIATSNIQNMLLNALVVNYHSLIDLKYSEIDNAGIMLLRLLKRIAVSSVALAGYDGFDINPHDNYMSDELINMVTAERLQERNSCIATQLQQMKKNLSIHMLTPSRYL